MRHGIEEARLQGHKLIVLVGDPDYYNPFGFTREQALKLQLPGPVEERRFIDCSRRACAVSERAWPRQAACRSCR